MNTFRGIALQPSQFGCPCASSDGLNGFGSVDTDKFVPKGSKLQYNVTFNDVSFGVNWGFNWLGSGWCRDAILSAIRGTGAFSDVYVVPGSYVGNNCTQAQINIVTGIDWNIGDFITGQKIGLTCGDGWQGHRAIRLSVVQTERRPHDGRHSLA
jgi:hypothetical protein